MRRGRGSRSAAAAQRSAAHLFRLGHSQRDGFSGDTEMITTTSNAKRAKHAKIGFVFAVFAAFAFHVTPALIAQGDRGLDPAQLLKPLADSWSSYSGDYTGRRYSALTQVNQANVKTLTLAFAAKITG